MKNLERTFSLSAGKSILENVATALGILTLFLSSGLAAQTFALTDTDPKSPEFKKKFLGSYGIHSEIEPKLEAKDRPLYESVLPYLTDRPEEAIRMVEKKINSESSAAFDFLLGNLYYSLENYQKSTENLETAIRKMPSFRRAWRTLALSQVQQEEFNASIDTWLQVISLGGGDAQSYSLLAYAYLTDEKYHSALKAYEMARMFKPKSRDIRRGEAQCLLMTNQYKRAIALFDELLQEEPANKDYWLFQVNAYLALEDQVSAISNLEIVRGMNKAEWEHLNLLGNLYLAQNNYSLALEVHKAALLKDRTISPKKAIEPLDSFVRMGQYELGYSYLQHFLSLRGEPEMKEFQVQKDILLARIQLNLPEHGDAVLTLQKVLERDPLNGAALLLLGEQAMESADFAQAEFYYERASLLDDFKSDAYIALGRMHVQKSQFKQALVYLKKAQRMGSTENLDQYILKVEQIADRL